MPFYKYEELTWPDFAGFDRDKTIIFVPIAPIEEHGPHLPMGVDFFNSVYFCEQGAKQIAGKFSDFNTIVYPGIPVGSDCFRFPGTMDLSPRAVYLVAKSMGRNLIRDGFKYVIFIALHGGPKHIAALEQACRELCRGKKISALAPFGQILIDMFTKRDFAEIAKGRELSDDEWYKFERDLHAGFIETSLMLKIKPGLVKNAYKLAKDYPLKLFEMRHHPFKRFENWQGQLGYPSLATEEQGELLSHNLLKYFTGFLEKWINGENLKKYNRSLSSKALIFNVNFTRWVVLITIFVLSLIAYFIFT